MKNRKFIKGVVIGAIVGGLMTLVDRDTRRTAWNHLKTTQNMANYYIKHPSTAIHDVNESYQQLSRQLSSGVNNTIYILGQLQDILESVDQDKGQGNMKRVK